MSRSGAAGRQADRGITGSMLVPDQVGWMVASNADMAPGAGSFWLAFSLLPSSATRFSGAASYIIAELGSYSTNGCLLNHFNGDLYGYVNAGGPVITFPGFFDSVPNGEFLRAMVVFDASGHVLAYLNGALYDTGPVPSWGTITLGTLAWGISPLLGAAGCPGYYQDVQMGVGVPVLADVQADHYRGVVAPGARHRWKLDDGSGSSAADSIGTATGALHGTASFAPTVCARRKRAAAVARATIPTAQNLVLRSQRFDLAAWTNQSLTISAPGAMAPDGTLTAQVLTDTVAGVGYYMLDQTPALTIGRTVTASVYAKAGTASWLVLSINGLLAASFDLGAGVLGTVLSANGISATITAEAHGFYRCSVTAVSYSGSGLQIRMATADYIGAVIDGDGTRTLTVWGAQVVHSNWPGPYVPTTTAVVDTGSLRQVVS